MYKKRKQILVTGGILTSLLLYGVNTSFAQSARTYSTRTGYVLEYSEPNTFAEHIELLIANGSIPETKIDMYKRILQKLEAAKIS